MRIVPGRVLAIGLWLLLAATAYGQSKIYYAEKKFFDPKLYRMNLDGTQVETFGAIPTSDWIPFGLALDPVTDKIYWQHGEANLTRIARGNLNGSGRETLIAGLVDGQGLTIDWGGGKMYWTDRTVKFMYRANTDGSGIQVIINSGERLGRPALDTDNGKIYFGNFATGAIERADLDGNNREVLVTDLVESPQSVALDLAGGKVYWIDIKTSTNYVARANLDGTGAEILVDFPNTSSGMLNVQLDLTQGKIVWCDETGADEMGVWVSNLDGSGATRVFSSPSGWSAGCVLVVEGEEPTGPLPCTIGTVDDANTGPVDVLFVNGSAGDANREVVVTDGEAITASMALPPAGGNGLYVIHGNLGRPSQENVTPLPRQIGKTCWPVLFRLGADPVVIANNAGRPGKVGRSNFFGTPTSDPDPAPSVFLQRTSDPNLAPGTILTLQGAVFDPGSTSRVGASSTNAVTIVVQ